MAQTRDLHTCILAIFDTATMETCKFRFQIAATDKSSWSIQSHYDGSRLELSLSLFTKLVFP